jgi:lambda family phage minor tail protein L
MPRTTSNDFILEKNKSLNRPIHLYTIHDYNGEGDDLRFAEYPSNVLYGDPSLEYVAFPIKFDSIKENNQGQVGTVTILISNVMRLLGGYMELYNFQGKKVTIRTVWYDLLADELSYIDDIYYIDAYAIDQSNATFSLTSKFNVLNVELPLCRYSRNFCGWVFKGTECGYASAGATVCNHTFTQCQALGNSERFGGFPSIKPKRAILA